VIGNYTSPEIIRTSHPFGGLLPKFDYRPTFSMKAKSSILIAIVLLIATWALPARAQGAKFRRAKKRVPNQYIVVLEPDNKPFARQFAATLAAQHSGRVIGIFDNVLGGFALEMTEEMAIRLSEHPRVQRVTEAAQVFLASWGTQSNPPSWGLQRIDTKLRADMDSDYTYSYSGTDVTAYILDTGVNDVGDIAGRIDKHVVCWNQSGCVDSPVPASDTMGYDCGLDNHGTSVASTLGGTVHGVAKDVRFKDVQVMSSCAVQFVTPHSITYLLNGLNWVKADHVTRNQDGLAKSVANISLDLQDDSIDVDQAIAELVTAGVTVVVGAGNIDRDACDNSPARAGNPLFVPGGASAITVGATDHLDRRAEWTTTFKSNYGECVDVFAPGKDLAATDRLGYTRADWGGTSAAAPHVAGLVALDLEKYSTPYGVPPPHKLEEWMKEDATPGVVTDINPVTPNLLIYTLDKRRRAADH
jgi:serine protease